MIGDIIKKNRGQLTIEDSTFTKNETISIYTIQGQFRIQQPMLQTKTNIDVSAFPGGIYIVEVKSEKGVALKKFRKE